MNKKEKIIEKVNNVTDIALTGCRVIAYIGGCYAFGMLLGNVIRTIKK